MSITSRINEMSSHIEQAYDELQGLGADLTNVDKNIENISMVLDDIYDSMPQVSGEGTSLTLDDTRVGKIKSTLKGNTSQTTYSGYNLCEFSSNQYSKVTVNNDGTIRINGTSVGFSINYNSITFESGTAYSCIYQLVSGSVNAPNGLGIMSAFGTSGYWPGSGVKETVTPSSNLTRQTMWVAEGAVFTNAVFKVLIYKGSDTKTWEPYVGSTPTNITSSPNPSYPQPVNVVSGDNEIVVCGKNFFDYRLFSNSTISGITLTNNNDGSVTINGTATATSVFEATSLVTIGENYKISGCYGGSSSTYKLDLFNPSASIFYPCFNGEETALPNNITGKVRIVVYSGTTINNVKIYPMLSTLGGEFQPYQGNTYNIDLPEGMELCKIGNYQDYFYKDNGKWYLHKEIGKVVLNGSESGWSYPSANRFNLDNAVDNYLKRQDYITYLSNYYEAFKQSIDNSVFNTLTTNTNYGFNLSSTPANNYTIRFKDTRYTSIADFKTWLSTHNLVIYYILAIPTFTEITYQPLIDQLNLLEKAMSKDGQTNISQVNNDLPFKITASALKEWSV